MVSFYLVGLEEGVLIHLTYVDLEVSIVNVNAVGCLLEVDVANAVNVDIVVGNDTEFRVGSSSLDSSGSSGDVVALETLSLDRRLLLDVCRRSVVRQAGQAVLADINAALGQARASLRVRSGMSVHVGSKASEAEKNSRLHCDKRGNQGDKQAREAPERGLNDRPCEATCWLIYWNNEEPLDPFMLKTSTTASRPSRKIFPSEFLISIQNPDVTLEEECGHVSQSRFTAS